MLRRNFCGSLIAAGAIARLARSQPQQQPPQAASPRGVWSAPTRASRTREKSCSRSRRTPTTSRFRRRHGRQADRGRLHRLPGPRDQRRHGRRARPRHAGNHRRARARQRARQRRGGARSGLQGPLRSELQQPPHGRCLAQRVDRPHHLSDSPASRPIPWSAGTLGRTTKRIPITTRSPRRVEAACWMAGRAHDFAEHFAAGLQPKTVQDKYYFARRPEITRVVDISKQIDKRVDAIRANVAKGPGGHSGSRLRAELAKRNQRLPLLGDDDVTADRNYIKEFSLTAQPRARQAIRRGIRRSLPLHRPGRRRRGSRSAHRHLCQGARRPGEMTGGRFSIAPRHA